MPLQFRHFKQILESWLSYVVGHSELSDVNPGSITRTFGEATALEISQVYVQLKTVLNLFSIDKASGADLDERALDFGLTRLQPTKSTGQVTFGDSDLTAGDIAYSTLAAVLTAGVSTTVVIQSGDYASFPASGSVIVGRSLATRELLAYSSKTGPDTLNLVGTPINSHVIGETVHLSTVGADRPIPIGTVIKTGDTAEIKFETTEAVTLYDGDYQVVNVLAQSQETGSANNVAGGRVTRFDTPPFPTATVINPSSFVDGQDLETDAEFRARIKESQQALSSSTKLRIESEALKVKLENTGQRVVTAKLIEPISPGVSTLYINDGTAAYSPSTASVEADEVLVSSAETGQVRASLDNWPVVSGTIQLVTSGGLTDARGVATGVGSGYLQDSGKSWTVNIWTGYHVKDSNDVFYEIASNTATQLTFTGTDTPATGAYAIVDRSTPLTESTDYVVNYTTGDIELDSGVFPTGLDQYDTLVAVYETPTAAYSYYNGLLQEVQKVINGDPNDIITYPGIKAAGTIVSITNPTVVSATVAGNVAAIPGVDETTLRDPVRDAILNYINNLNIGDDVLIAKIIAAAMSIEGVQDFSLTSPTSNISVTDTQLAKSTISDVVIT